MCFDSILQSVHYSADEISSKSLMEVLSFSTIYILYLFSATLFFHSVTFWRQILYFLLHYFQLLVALQITSCIRGNQDDKTLIPITRKMLNIRSSNQSTIA